MLFVPELYPSLQNYTISTELYPSLQKDRQVAVCTEQQFYPFINEVKKLMFDNDLEVLMTSTIAIPNIRYLPSQ